MDVKQKLNVLFRSKAGAIWITTDEELRAKRTLAEVAAALDFKVMLWSCASGMSVFGSNEWDEEFAGDPGAALTRIDKDEERAIYCFLDLKSWLKDDPMLVRLLREKLEYVPGLPRQRAKVIAVIDRSSAFSVPGVIPVDFPLPTKEQIGQILDELLDTAPESVKMEMDDNGARSEVVNALSGLQADVVSSTIGQSIVATKRVDPKLLIESKRQLLKQDSRVEWWPTDPLGLGALGGYDRIMAAIDDLAIDFTEGAAEYGMPKPKGLVLTGWPGTGKSHLMKATAARLGLPLLKVGNTESKYVGEGKDLVMDVFRTARAMAPVILGWDEIEKEFAASDSDKSGSTQKNLAVILTEIQEDTSGIFLMATANDAYLIPGPLLRRFDAGIWWLDLPTPPECQAIYQVMSVRYPQASKINCESLALVAADKKFTGAEIETTVIGGMRIAYADGKRKVKTADVLARMDHVTPVVNTIEEWKREKLVNWQKLAQPASEPFKKPTRKVRPGKRALELD